MAHRDSHPVPVPGCFGCRVQNVGVQTLQIKYGKDPVQRVSVIGEEGPRGGKPVGRHDVHWNGSQDAKVFAPSVDLKSSVRET